MMEEKIDFEEFHKKCQREREIRCPHCDTLQENDDGQYPVTYWGDDSYTEMVCQECEEKFWVKENVTRTYDVAKTYDELGI